MKAVFWTAWGEQYIAEAHVSARSVQRYMPGLPRFLMAQGTVDNKKLSVFKRLSPPQKRVRGRVPEGLASLGLRVDAIRQLSDYTELIFLDSDTFLCAPVFDFFNMLKRYDFVGVISPGRITRKTVSPIPATFPEYNGGVLVFRNTPKVLAFWENALRLYEENQQVYKRGNQGVIREAVWLDESGLQFGTAPPEYCVRFPFGLWTRRPPKILHGRPNKLTYPQICQRIKKKWAWGPGELATPHPGFKPKNLPRGGKA